MARIIWSLGAIEALEEICNYIAKDSQKASEKIARAMKDRVDALASSPFIGRIVPDQRGQVDRNLRELIFGNYRIIYHIDEDIVSIITVFHAKRDFKMDKDDMN